MGLIGDVLLEWECCDEQGKVVERETSLDDGQLGRSCLDCKWFRDQGLETRREATSWDVTGQGMYYYSWNMGLIV